jgi:hypothetical protein
MFAPRLLASPEIVDHGARTPGEAPADGYTQRDIRRKTQKGTRCLPRPGGGRCPAVRTAAAHQASRSCGCAGLRRHHGSRCAGAPGPTSTTAPERGSCPAQNLPSATRQVRERNTPGPAAASPGEQGCLPAGDQGHDMRPLQPMAGLLQARTGGRLHPEPQHHRFPLPARQDPRRIFAYLGELIVRSRGAQIIQFGVLRISGKRWRDPSRSEAPGSCY